MAWLYRSNVICSCFVLLSVIVLGVANDLEARRFKCSRSKHFAPVRKPFDLNSTFLPILNGEKWSELSPKVLSTDPWIVYFENFLSEAEVQAAEDVLFAQKFDPSPAGGGTGRMQARHSETAFCTGDCDKNSGVQVPRQRASEVTGVPIENMDFSQGLRYKEDANLVGGATGFPRLGHTAPAKRGAAVLFVNTKDRSPMETDPRTMHESQVVKKGLKRGMNLWLYQYNYRDFWQKGCTGIDLADDLGKIDKAAVDMPRMVTVENNAKKNKLSVYRAIEDTYAPVGRDPWSHKLLGHAEPGGKFTFETNEGNVIRVYAGSPKKGKLVKEYPVKSSLNQRVVLGGPSKEAEKATQEEL